MLPSCCAHQLSQITLAPAENEPPDLLFQICVCVFMFYVCPFLSMPVSQSPSCLSFQVGPQSTLVRTQCLCNHLTYFGSDFFLVPRTVNVEDVAELFLRVTSNPVGVSLLASLVGIYMLIFMWAWRKDQADAQKVMRLWLWKLCHSVLSMLNKRKEKRDTFIEKRQVSEVAQLCPTLCDPMDYSLPGSSVHGIFQAIVLGWIAISFCRGSSRPWDRIQLSRIVDRCFPVWANVLKVPGKW